METTIENPTAVVETAPAAPAVEAPAIAAPKAPRAPKPSREEREAKEAAARAEKERAAADALLAQEKAALKHAEDEAKAAEARRLAMETEAENQRKLVTAIAEARKEKLAKQQAAAAKKAPKVDDADGADGAPKLTPAQLAAKKAAEARQAILDQLALADKQAREAEEAVRNEKTQPEYELFMAECKPFQKIVAEVDAIEASKNEAAEKKIAAIRASVTREMAALVLKREKAQRQLALLELTNPRREAAPVPRAPRAYNGTSAPKAPRAASAPAAPKEGNVTITYHVTLSRQQVMDVSTNPASKVRIVKEAGVDVGEITQSRPTAQRCEYEARRAIKLALGATLVEQNGRKEVVGGSFDPDTNVLSVFVAS